MKLSRLSPIQELNRGPVLNTKNESSRILRIFLCHASGDKPAVRELYKQLQNDGFNPWLDEEDLLPGQDWQREIPKVVHRSDAVIVCLSRHSISKAGYVQKEIKYVLDVADEQPEDAIFVIPLKLEECEVPDRLSRWHWVNFFDEKGYERLIKSLKLRSTTVTEIPITPSPAQPQSRVSMESQNLTIASSSTGDGVHLFLHLSDIHFHKARSNNPYDLDEDLRRQLSRDAQEIVEKIGRVTAILVTGDIAFSGHPREYNIAAQWLDSLAEVVQCQPKIILTTPGNHDIDRYIYNNDRTLRGYHQELRACTPENVDEVLTSLFMDETARIKLYEPLINYNHFAANYGCDINHERPCWERTLDLNEHITLRIRGLNSVIASNPRDDDEPRKLCLGLHQVQVDDVDPRIIHLTLCHHPPDWLIDNDNVHAYLSDRVHLQLFGHKHSQRVDVINGHTRLTAGAVHPSRREINWQPRYNFIQIWTTYENHIHHVNFRIYPRVWKGTKFDADFAAGGIEFVEHSVTVGRDLASHAELDNVRSPNSDVDVPILPVDEKVELILEESIDIISDDGTAMSNTINYAPVLVRRFLNLSVYDQRLIIQELNLAASDERTRSGPEFLKLVFSRAKERKCLGELWEKIEAAHNDGLYQTNPFTDK